MNISHTLIILCNIMLSYSLIKPGLSTAYKRNIPERKNFTLRTPVQTQKNIIQTTLILKNINVNENNKNNDKNDNTTSVRININPHPLITDSSLRAHMIAMLFI